MNLLPAMLMTTAIIGGTGQISADISAINTSAISEQLKNNCMESEIMIGSPSDLEDILKDLNINLDKIKDCIIPSVPSPEPELPDTETPAPEAPAPEAPTPEIPDNETPAPETPDHENTKPGQDAEKSYAEQVVDLVNAERAKVNLPALTMSEGLNKAALIRGEEITLSFSHTRPNGSSFSSVLKENGITYKGAGENIAWGQQTPEAVVNAWMNSEGHRANILNKNFTSIGVGYYLKGSTPYWVQLFTY